MSVLQVITVPNPLLKQVTVDVNTFDEKLQQLVFDMFETMAHYQGVGLAAPQVGILQSLVVIMFEKKELILINPEIIFTDGQCVDEEGCLSIPGLRRQVERAENIIVNAFDVVGNPIQIKEEGFMARIILHEIDHLRGILITDKKEILSEGSE
ncbi:MAG: peptide deformylase [Candidatus Margulisbacteria bacterium]|nr:peptide deformylase [Candidatus Margulisiibacteriota bacterium]